MTPLNIALAVILLHALALTLAVGSAKARTDIVSGALMVSAALATLNGYTIATLYL